MQPELLTSSDRAFLSERLRRGEVTLFLGAGFSLGAKNGMGASPPLGRELARLLSSEMGYEHSEEPLQTVFALAAKRLGAIKLREFLDRHFRIEECADWHGLIPTFVWRRIYTTNIDTVLDVAYRGSREQRLHRIVCPADPEERDQLFDKVQAIHLHGCVAETSSEVTFTFADFAQQAVRPNPWYQELADDLFRTPILFVGTELHDSPFHHYVGQRGQRARGTSEFRPRSFLVSPSVTELRSEQLRDSNIVAVKTTSEEFFRYLRGVIPKDATAIEQVRQLVRPDLIIQPKGPVSDPTIARHFYLIRSDLLPRSPAELVEGQFFLGAEPTWRDIDKNRDGRRDITRQVVSALLASPLPRCLVLHGPAGSGKSTTAMRAAERIASEGHAVWFAHAAEKLDLAPLLDKIHSTDSPFRHYIFIDVAMRQLGSIQAVLDRLKSSSRVSLVLVDRTNAFARRQHALGELDLDDIAMPDLTDGDIHSIIERLDYFGFLEVLKGKSPDDRFHAFKERAEKQLFVAMREATSGRGFDLILHDEYHGLHDQAKLAYLIACLVVAQGAHGVQSRHLRACLDRSEYSKGAVLSDLLRGVLVSANDSGSLLKPRHRLIAHWVSHEVATDDLKFDAIVRFLRAVSGDIVPNEIRRRSPAFLGYRGLVNSEGLKGLFANATKALDVYESVRDLYCNEFLFWLQFGMAEMEAGRYDIAENYLNQSLSIIESLRLDPFQPMHQLGILHLRIATNMDNPELAIDRASQGMEILEKQIQERGMQDSYPYVAYLQYVSMWYLHARDIIPSQAWEELRVVADRARQIYALDNIVVQTADEVERKYLQRTIGR